VSCSLLHRTALPMVSEWYQKRRSCDMIVLARSMHPKEVQHLDGHTSIQLTVELLLALDAEYEQDTPTAWTRSWRSDAAYRRGQCLARCVRDLIQGYRSNDAFTILYIEPTPQHVGVDHQVWLR
jgi:hypothetical protein